jgi:hypothetical protein
MYSTNSTSFDIYLNQNTTYNVNIGNNTGV